MHRGHLFGGANHLHIHKYIYIQVCVLSYLLLVQLPRGLGPELVVGCSMQRVASCCTVFHCAAMCRMCCNVMQCMKVHLLAPHRIFTLWASRSLISICQDVFASKSESISPPGPSHSTYLRHNHCRVCTCTRVFAGCSFKLREEGGGVQLFYTEHFSLGVEGYFEQKQR